MGNNPNHIGYKGLEIFKDEGELKNENFLINQQLLNLEILKEILDNFTKKEYKIPNSLIDDLLYDFFIVPKYKEDLMDHHHDDFILLSNSLKTL